MCVCIENLDNRWLVTLNSDRAATHLVGAGIDLYNRHIFVRHYDDVLADEYVEYLQYRDYEHQLHLVKHGINATLATIGESIPSTVAATSGGQPA